MGKLEKEARVVRRNTSIQNAVLRTIGTAGLISVAVLAPNALQVLRILDGGKKRRSNPKYYIGTAFEKLCARGYVTIERGSNGKHARLSQSGKVALERMIARSPDVRKRKRWDKRWRIVIYDIKEKNRATRTMLQRTLQSYGFCKLQNSVWVYPHDCEELVVMLKANYKVGQDVLYLVVEKIENDQKLKEYFC